MIKNLLFDLGGVIMDIEKNRCIAAFERLGLPNAASYFGEYSQQGPFKLIEEGMISEKEFHDALRKDIANPVTDKDIDDAFCDFLIGIPLSRLQQLRELRSRYKIYMLSNTNPIMWNSKIKKEFEQEGFAREDYFDGMVTSFDAKSLKPDGGIFRYAIDQLCIKPEETLFLDDSMANLRGAEPFGFKTAHVHSDHGFMEVIKRISL